MNNEDFERVDPAVIRVHYLNEVEQLGDVTEDDPTPVDVYNRIIRLENSLKGLWEQHSSRIDFIFEEIENKIDKLRTEVLLLKCQHIRVGSSVVVLKDRKIGVVEKVSQTHCEVKIDNEDKVVLKRLTEVQKIG